MDNTRRELLQKRSMASDRCTIPITPSVVTNIVIDDDELFMEYTMTATQKPNCVNFMIIGEIEALVYCRMKTTSSLRKLMRLYARSLNIPSHLPVFHYNDMRLYGTDCPLAIGLMEGDTIIVAHRRIRSYTVVMEVLE